MYGCGKLSSDKNSRNITDLMVICVFVIVKGMWNKSTNCCFEFQFCTTIIVLGETAPTPTPTPLSLPKENWYKYNLITETEVMWLSPTYARNLKWNTFYSLMKSL